jgi:serine/threonine protein kinase
MYPPTDLSEQLPKLKGDGIDLILKMLESSPDKRINADEALSRIFILT